MSLKIKANSFFVHRYLKLTDRQVIHCETAAIGGVRKFGYEAIDYVLVGQSDGKMVLSLQVGTEMFSIPFSPRNTRHQQVVNELVRRVQATVAHRGHGFDVVPVRQG